MRREVWAVREFCESSNTTIHTYKHNVWCDATFYPLIEFTHSDLLRCVYIFKVLDDIVSNQ